MTAQNRRSAIVRRVLSAPPDVVYDEWLDPEALAAFICPHPATPGPIACDPRVGGQLSIVMVGVSRVVRITGQYLELERPKRLRFTWNSDLGGGFDSVVTVTLEPHGEDQTLMTIDHAQLPPAWSPDHERGWSRIAEQLDWKIQARG